MQKSSVPRCGRSVTTPPSSLISNDDLRPSRQLQNVSGFDDENEEVGKKRCVRYLCAVEVTLPNHGVRSQGVGLGEADVGSDEGSFWPLDFVPQ